MWQNNIEISENIIFNVEFEFWSKNVKFENFGKIIDIKVENNIQFSLGLKKMEKKRNE